MALSFASIGSRYSHVKSDKLNPADRDYLDECRRNSARSTSSTTATDYIDPNRHLQPHPLASSKLSINPYHESFRAAQHEVLQQRILRRASKGSSWTWKRTLVLTVVLTLLLTSVIVVACINAKGVRQGHYVRFFGLLIGAIILGSFVVVIGSKLYPWMASRMCKRSTRGSRNCPETTNIEAAPEEERNVLAPKGK